MTMKLKIDNYLDAAGLLCPEPVMMLHQMVRSMASGELIEVTATDPSTTRDIPKFCHFLGHKLVQSNEVNGVYLYIIELK